MERFLTVGQQVLALFILIFIGLVCGKKGILSETVARALADLTLLIATPCVIVESFMREVAPEKFVWLGVAALAALAVHGLSILLARLAVRDKDESRRRVLRFGVVFSNAGYMSIPLQKALLGEDGVLVGAAYLVVFNLVLWSYGLLEMSGDRRSLSVKKLVFNPGMIGLAVGMLVFLLPFSLPETLAVPIRSLSALNTPLPMLVIGYYLGKTDLKQALRDRGAYVAAGLRLAVLPLLSLGGMWLCGIRGTVLISCMIAVCAPAAAATTMFATRYSQDTALSVNLVSLTTLLSAVTMPLIVGLAQILA